MKIEYNTVYHGKNSYGHNVICVILENPLYNYFIVKSTTYSETHMEQLERILYSIETVNDYIFNQKKITFTIAG